MAGGRIEYGEPVNRGHEGNQVSVMLNRVNSALSVRNEAQYVYVVPA
jgi:hypothetical protein